MGHEASGEELFSERERASYFGIGARRRFFALFNTVKDQVNTLHVVEPPDRHDDIGEYAGLSEAGAFAKPRREHAPPRSAVTTGRDGGGGGNDGEDTDDDEAFLSAPTAAGGGGGECAAAVDNDAASDSTDGYPDEVI